MRLSGLTEMDSTAESSLTSTQPEVADISEVVVLLVYLSIQCRNYDSLLCQKGSNASRSSEAAILVKDFMYHLNEKCE